MNNDKVLVTGISGFIGAHVAARLLQKGYHVRGTARNLDKAQKVVDQMSALGFETNRIELCQAELGSDEGWQEAVKDCRYIQHVASPLPLEAPSHREALVPEARAGAQRVLENGLSAGAERIVMTSSIAAMIGQKGRAHHMRFGEQDWSDPDWKALPAYPVSKTRAELSAWAYVKAQDCQAKLTTICPGLVLGPDDFGNGSASLEVIIALLRGDFPMVPKLAFPLVDVRDVVSIHVAAMTRPEAAGRRLIAASGTLSFLEIADILRQAYPAAQNLPRAEMPNGIVKLISLFDDRLKTMTSDLGVRHEADAAYVTTITQVVPRPAREAVLAAADSLIKQGRVTL